MEETQQRLKESADACIKAYDVWGSSKKNAEAREALQEAVHELRKVAARLEIEMASSERDEMTQRPISIPPHRASRGRGNENSGNELSDFITDGGQDSGDGNQPNSNRPRPQSQGRRNFGGQNRRPPRSNDGNIGNVKNNDGPQTTASE